MLVVEQWAELRRLHFAEGVGVRELARRFGLHRTTVRRALGSADPPKYARPPAPSKLDPFKDEIHRRLTDEPRLPAVRLRELLQPLGSVGGETILKEHLREVRPLFLRTRTYQRTVYLPGELAQCDLWEPRAELAVGFGQTRRGYVVTCTPGYSKVGAGTLIFSKEAPEILAGLLRCLVRIGGLPQTLVWDREGALHAGLGRPTEASPASAASSRSAGSSVPRPIPKRRGSSSAVTGSLKASFEPGRQFAGPLDFQDQLDRWYTERANPRFHRGIRARPIDRLAEEQLRPLPAPLPDLDRRWVLRVPPQPYVRVDSTDYSLDPTFVGRRVELRVSPREVSAVVLDTGELAAQHLRTFARYRTVTASAHAAVLRDRRGAPPMPVVEIRPLARYDALIPS